MRLPQIDFDKVMVLALVGGSVIHPASSAFGLLILAAAKVAERYFTRNITDKDRRDISLLKTEMEKISAVQQKDGLAKAFGPRA